MAFFEGLRAEVGSPRDRPPGRYGRIYDWMARGHGASAAFSPLRDVLRKHILDNWPLDEGELSLDYSTNYLIDTDHALIVDAEATRSIRQTEVGSVRTMLDRVRDSFDLHPERIIADTAYGFGPTLGWLVDRKIAPHVPVIDIAGLRRKYSDPDRGPAGKDVAQYQALKLTCQACPSKPKCCPNADARKITRVEHEDARQVARDIHCPAVQIYMHERGHDERICGINEAQKEDRDALRPPQTKSVARTPPIARFERCE